MFRARPNRPSVKSRPKSKPTADHASRPGKHCPAVGQAQRSRHAAHDHAARAGNKASRPRNPFAYHGRCIRPSRENHPAEIFVVRPRRPTRIRPARPFRLGQRPDCPADRPDRPSERRGRPEAVFEAQSAQFKPKAGADLARLGLAVFLYLEHYKYFFLAL
ncbi:unnamed protein product [Microthlaspi erraticum]|uniref:Uncharacterized protein n=1 Tax=Microthlaspi erraticum TaxID=1685480 RepID=A0A6D2KJX5_9BRAS|nr:unnamed protein product [Microthlaspi erraticum]